MPDLYSRNVYHTLCCAEHPARHINPWSYILELFSPLLEVVDSFEMSEVDVVSTQRTTYSMQPYLLCIVPWFLWVLMSRLGIVKCLVCTIVKSHSVSCCIETLHIVVVHPQSITTYSPHLAWFVTHCLERSFVRVAFETMPRSKSLSRS